MIRPSFERLMDDVRRGTLDFTLTKPEDAQLLVSIRQVQLWKLGDVALGLIVLLVALDRLGSADGGWRAVLFIAGLLAGGTIVYSFLLILATCSFWLVRVENLLTIFQSMYEAGRWPIGIYPRWLRWSLTFLAPVAFATSVPAAGLTGRLSAQTLLGAGALAIGLLVVSRWFWGVGLRHYSGASA
jgi:ABC-2 type transport system permease protein